MDFLFSCEVMFAGHERWQDGFLSNISHVY